MSPSDAPDVRSRTRGEERQAGIVDRAVMRSLDVAVAAVTLTVLAPALAIIALAIRRGSPGPALFVQERVGRDGRRFELLKFRTMRTDTDEAPHREFVRALIQAPRGPQLAEATQAVVVHKLTGDRRITGIGRVLRAWSLDELPQLINVLRGEMSLVGPRPVIAYEAELFSDEQCGRFTVNPGLTGLWQVSGRNHRTYQEMLELDLEYVARRSPAFDVSILLRTVPVVIGRRGVA